MWHVSVSVWKTRRLAPTSDLRLREIRVAQAFALQLLGEVGVTGNDRRERMRLAFHVRRKLAPGEIARLTPAFLAIPAVDTSGPDGEPW